ncbi:hypothetical protein LIER_40769 [Lithospermum erythrorhizon]|uniref:Uncharacterized protein n=1 Tax=Lithospermum erythrorhizon TaxID=34254 RepID=A0AAV3R2F9_LITER
MHALPGCYTISSPIISKWNTKMKFHNHASNTTIVFSLLILLLLALTSRAQYSPPPPPSPPPIPCGHGGHDECPDDSCCSLIGICAEHYNRLCEPDLCFSNCTQPPQCGPQAGGQRCTADRHCCTTAGQCAIYESLACLTICASQCRPTLINSS